MAKKKKELTTKQKQNKYRATQYAAIGGIFASLITPFIVLGIINFEEWFKSDSSWRIGIGATLGLAVAGFAIAIVTFKKEKDMKATEGWITFIVIWFAAAMIVKCFEVIYSQLFEIMMWTWAGILVAFGFNIFSGVERKKADAYQEARAEIKKEGIKEQAKREVEQELKQERMKAQNDRPIE